MPHQRLVVLSALTLTMVISACANKAPDAVTISSGPPAATISDSTGPNGGTATSDPVPAQVTPLTQAQLTSALPSAKELGKGGWRIAKTSSASSKKTKEKVSPEHCRLVYDSLQPELAGNKVASAQRDYQASKYGPFVGVTLTSYKEVPATGVFDDLAAAISKCPKFTSTDAKGAKTTFVASPLKFPNVGDQTFATRLVATTGTKWFSLTMTLDVAMATKGAASVAVVNAGIGKLFQPSTSLAAIKAALAHMPA